MCWPDRKGPGKINSRNGPILMLFSGDFNVRSVNILRRIVAAAGRIRGFELEII
jgi:hypothetical protein